MPPEPDTSSSTAGESSKDRNTASEDSHEDEDGGEIGGPHGMTLRRSAEDEDEDEICSSHDTTSRRSAEDEDEDEICSSHDTTSRSFDVRGDTPEIDLSISAFQPQLVNHGVSNPSNIRSLDHTVPAANEINGKGDEGSGMHNVFSLCPCVNNPLLHKITLPLNLPSWGNVSRA
jgi:hypothetical protein